MDTALTASRWDDEYRNRRYEDEPALPFVDTIVALLKADATFWNGTGLYVGCGNGRNYLPLVDAGLDLFGLDVSPEAINALSERRPALPRDRLVREDFRVFARPDASFDYLIAFQVFQHGDESDIASYFSKAAALLKPGGLFFLRANSATTEVYHRHAVVERNTLDGFTIRYDEGPKTGLLVHFFSRAELADRSRMDFVPVMEPREELIVRETPKTGSWAQWEAVWKRRGSRTP